MHGPPVPDLLGKAAPEPRTTLPYSQIPGTQKYPPLSQNPEEEFDNSTRSNSTRSNRIEKANSRQVRD
jgi:hypothetical protein